MMENISSETANELVSILEKGDVPSRE